MFRVGRLGCQRGSAPSPAAPDIPTLNLILWLKADAGTYAETSRTTPVSANGAEVEGWADQSGTGNHASAVGGTGPVIKTGGANGKSALTFTDNVMSFAQTNAPTAGDFFIVAAGSTGGHVLTGGETSASYFYLHTNWSRFNIVDTEITSYVDMDTHASDPFVANAWFNATEVKCEVNGVHEAVSDETTVPGVRDITADPGKFDLVSIGNLVGDPGNSPNADIYEIITYSRKLEDAEREAVLSYLNTKYNIY